MHLEDAPLVAAPVVALSLAEGKGSGVGQRKQRVEGRCQGEEPREDEWVGWEER